MFAPSHTIPGQSCIFAHLAFIQLQIHSFYVVYALSASYIHWPVVSDHFEPCFDLFPAYFALFLPSMMVKQTFPIFFFMVPKKRLFSCNKKVTPYVSRRLATATIYTVPVVLALSKNAYWLRMNETSDLSGFKPQTRKECLLNQGKRKRRKGVREKGDVVCLKALNPENRSIRGGTLEVRKL